MKIQKFNNESLNLTMVQTTKFKTTRIQINFLSDMKTDITARGLLPYILKSVSKEYPTREKLSIHLEEMYAAQLGVTVSKLGKSHIVTFDLSVIDDLYTLNHESLLEKGVQFLNSIIFNPFFDKSIFEEESRLIEEYFEGIYANKLKYSMQKLIQTMFRDEIYKYQALGNLKELKTITLQDIKNEHSSMINSDNVYITVVGNIEFDKTKEIINNNMSFNKAMRERVLTDRDKPSNDTFTEIIEQGDVNQSKLVIGYRTNTYYREKDYYQALVFNALFGGTSESLLFNKIREEMGKVYFISTNYDPDKGVLFIYSGIASNDYEVVIESIDNVLQDIINMNYSDKLLETIKTVYKNSIISSLDSTYSLISRYFRTSLFNTNFDQEEIIKKLVSVTKEDISLVAKKLKKDTVFLLKDNNNEKI